MSPAEVVIDTFHGIRATARVVAVQPSTVCRWLKPREHGGTGGRVPPEYHDQLLEAAEKLRCMLTAEHLRVGKPGLERRVIRRF